MLTAVPAVTPAAFGQDIPTLPPPSYPPGSIQARLEAIRSEYNLPALAAAVVDSGEVTEWGAVGFRKYGESVAVTAEDLWHIGSCTKSMTATLAARLVQQGVVSWGTTIAQALPDLASSIDPAFREVTLEQLLAHRAGLMPNEDPQLRGRIRLSEAPLEEQRSLFVAAVLGRPPTSPPGTAWAYSNAGYVVAGTMIERLAGAPWEELIGRELFAPLGLTSAGFGAPGTPGGALDQPWGHIPREGGWSPVQPGPWADNPPALGPAGRVHLSIGDFARYAAMHLRAARGDHSFLAEDSVARLHTPHSESGDALGWLVQARPGEEGGPLLLHDGSNGMFYALIVIAPERNRAIVLATNAGGEGAGRALAAALALFKL